MDCELGLQMNEQYDIQTVKIMEKILTPTSNCVDVGCHRGDILRHMVRLAPQGIHHAFEPIPALCAEVSNAFPEVKAYELALSDSTGVSSFKFVTSNPAYSGLRARRYDRPNEIVEEIQVRTELLDNIIPPQTKIALIKIDVEGAEYQVMKGAVNVLMRDKPFIIFEHGLGGSDYYGTTPNQVYDLFQECGLSVTLMSDWLSGNETPLSLNDFNGQFYDGLNYYFLAYPQDDIARTPIS